MSALLQFAPPIPGADLPLPDVCEFDSILLPVTSAPSARPSRIIQGLPSPGVVHPGGRPPTGSDSTLTSTLTAKDAFLPPKNNERRVRKAVSKWYEEGLLSALEQLATTGSKNDLNVTGNSIWQRLVVTVARSILAVYRMSTNIHSSFNPHLMMSGEDMIDRFSEIRDWTCSAIRGIAWHPHTLKFAVAFKDDTIEVHGPSLPASPLLKYKLQKGVACLAWRPFNASELAVGCQTGIVLWTLDPNSVAARPSASSVSVLQASGHAPISALEWDPKGKLLLSSSAADTSMILWNTASECHTPLRRVGGGGVHLVKWSPSGHSILAATPTTVFRVWETRLWTHERWNVLEGHINTACWSPCGTYLLFATSSEPLIFMLNFSTSVSSANAVPVVDLTAVEFVDEEKSSTSIGGIIQSLKWDTLGERLAVTFVDCDVIAIFCTSLRPILSFSPIGLIAAAHRGETPSCIEFAKKFDEGALLTVGWSSGRLQYIPMLFVPNVNGFRNNESFLNSKNVILHPEFEGGAEALEERPTLFSTIS